MKRYKRKFKETYDKEELNTVKLMWKKYNKSDLDKDLEDWVIERLQKGKDAFSILVSLGITNLK
jgi:hypothetical protein